MKADWLWDRRMTESDAKRILKRPCDQSFIAMAALLFARKNEPREVFKRYIDPIIFCRNWHKIKRKMRSDKWGEPRIIFWQAIYEKLIEKYRKKGLGFKEKISIREPLCESVGKKIAAIRHAQGLSQKSLAKKIGVFQQLISRLEKGSENASLITLASVARALNTTLEVNFISS